MSKRRRNIVSVLFVIALVALLLLVIVFVNQTTPSITGNLAEITNRERDDYATSVAATMTVEG